MAYILDEMEEFAQTFFNDYSPHFIKIFDEEKKFNGKKPSELLNHILDEIPIRLDDEDDLKRVTCLAFLASFINVHNKLPTWEEFETFIWKG